MQIVSYMDTSTTRSERKSRPQNPRAKEGKKDGQDEKKERLKPYTVKDFIQSKYGALLLAKMEAPFKERTQRLLERGDPASLRKYMRALVRLFSSWAQSSPLCGNKRTKAYPLLKEIEIAARTQKILLGSGAEGKGADEDIEQADTREREHAGAEKGSESAGSFFENTQFDTQSFSLLETTQTENDTQSMHMDSISDLLDALGESSDEGVTNRQRARK
ncbi:uncharacterized protein NEMAJ01_1197 [Nematocida major]|uniref:uncharacterized protein n=1 Tax=Nematocida major TaxID=1912982 RepID=UPI0020082FA3|nr:uncharacterized protein NEMAJ01_1197 [Nematocida major]KAH9386301.1 hypothetical protein NEMAJ01_1197 [Nematocida major]